MCASLRCTYMHGHKHQLTDPSVWVWGLQGTMIVLTSQFPMGLIQQCIRSGGISLYTTKYTFESAQGEALP